MAALAPTAYTINGMLAGLSLIKKYSPVVISVAGAYLLYDVWKNWDKLQKSKDRISFVVDLVLNDMMPTWAKNSIVTGAGALNQGALKTSYKMQLTAGAGGDLKIGWPANRMRNVSARSAVAGRNHLCSCSICTRNNST